jgi:hypothetical protein
MIKIIQIIILLSISLFSCSKDDLEKRGVCESKWGISSPDYYCAVTGEDNCFVGVHKYYDEKSCKLLGYTVPYDRSNGPTGIKFISPDGIKTPGDNGYFANPSSSSGSGGSSGASCDLANYVGPEFNIQVDSQCKAAYAYDCAGMIDARDVACNQYYEYGNNVWTGPGALPTCPYCN